MDALSPLAEAIAIRGNRILAVGTNDHVLSHRAGRAETIDLKGCMVTPGLTDAHIHFEWWSRGLAELDLEGARSLDEALERIRRFCMRLSPGAWLRGHGWVSRDWSEARLPTRWDLDTIVGDRPVYLTSKDGHVTWVSTKSLELAGLASDTPDPIGGRFERDANGRLTGILKESAAKYVQQILPEPDLDARAESFTLGTKTLYAMGVTSVHCPEESAFPALCRALYQQERLGLRVYAMIPLRDLDDALRRGVRTGQGNEWLRTGPVKIFSDGALTPETAYMLDPYEGSRDNVGLAVVPYDEMKDAVKRAAGGGLSCAIHAIGDRANREVLDVFESVLAESRHKGLRHRIEHAQVLHPNDLGRFAATGTIASMQPLHCPSDRYRADRSWGARARLAYAFRSLLATGALLAFGSDAPVESPDPRLGIHGAVTRRRRDEPHSGPWYPQECISVAEALHAYTLGAAFASHEEQIKGSLTPGKLADVAIFGEDLTAVTPDDIPHIPVCGTILDGRFVHRESWVG